MRIKFWFTAILLLLSIKLYGQNIRVNNSFIIVVNNKLAKTVSGLQLILSDTIEKKETIDGGYLPGELYVTTTGEKNVLYADSIRTLTLKFDIYEQSGNREVVHNYSIVVNRKWFKSSLIILNIFDINKRKGTYKYTFEVPGYSFGIVK